MPFIYFLGIFVYFIPSIIAAFNGHESAATIFALNLFTGWTFIGWVIALFWSL